MGEAVILSAVRTPIGGFQGALASVPAVELGATVVGEALRRAGVDPRDLDEVLMGNVLSAGLGQNPARQAALRAGVPDSVPATTVDNVCGSGLKAVCLAAQAIAAGDAELLVAGGMENMSATPHLLQDSRGGHRMGDATLVDSMLRDGLTCAFEDVHMGVTAENVATEYEVGRDDQDAFALRSQARAALAIEEGALKAEIVPVAVPQRRGEPVLVVEDEHPRPATDIASLGRLRPLFTKDGGTVTAGNASGINDGAAAVVVADRERAEALGRVPLATIRGYGSAGVHPRIMGMGPVDAIRRALDRAGVTLDDIDLIELNEAFAAQSLAVSRELGLDPDRVNVHGGAIALGHPIGASGARVLTTLLHAMERRDVRYGLAALCIGGGQGIAMVVEREPSLS